MNVLRNTLAVCTALILLDCGVGSQAAARPKFIEFDPPGSIETLVFTRSLNSKGDVTGFYYKNDDIQRAFIRTKSGDFSDIATSLSGPEPTGINVHDATTGHDDFREGFIAAKDGSITTFYVPGTGNSGYGTNPRVIDDMGNVAGYYTNPLEYNVHGFFRDKNGHFTTFDAPNAGAQPDQGTYVTGLNSSGYIAGWVADANGVAHGFLRAPDGAMSVIDISNAGTGPDQGTKVIGLNENGAVTGWFLNARNRIHGFLRDIDGNVTLIDVNKAGNDSNQGTTALAVNNYNVVAGDYVDSAGAYHGFMRLATGKIKTFDAPDAVIAFGKGTSVGGINDDGKISGYYDGTDGTYHGFLRKP